MSITVAKTAGFVTRAQWGARSPRSVSRNISPGQGGVALHYGGHDVPVTSHSSCVRRWKSWQDYHMNHHGWVDIAYTMGVCQHGYVFAGRGAGVRTAANGSNHGNNTHYAVCWIGGARQTISAAALSAYAWAINELRNKGGAGLSVKPHSTFNSTACPGTPISNAAKQVDGKRIGTTAPKPPPPPLDEWEVFWMSLSDAEKKVLKEFASAVQAEGTSAGSFVRQLLKRHREDIPRLVNWTENVDGLIKKGNTSLQGVIIGGVNTIDAVRDQGYEIGTNERHGVRKTS